MTWLVFDHFDSRDSHLRPVAPPFDVSAITARPFSFPKHRQDDGEQHSSIIGWHQLIDLSRSLNKAVPPTRPPSTPTPNNLPHHQSLLPDQDPVFPLVQASQACNHIPSHQRQASICLQDPGYEAGCQRRRTSPSS